MLFKNCLSGIIIKALTIFATTKKTFEINSDKINHNINFSKLKKGTSLINIKYNNVTNSKKLIVQ